MKRFMLAMVAAVAVSSGTGCCCLDRLFCCKPWSCCDTCGGGCGCDSCCGGCDSCGGGCGCDSCGGGYSGGGGGCGCASNGGGQQMGGYAAHGGSCGPNGCGCGHNGIAAMPGSRNGGNMGPGGPPTAAVTYPYYTTRGPRDYLARNPQSIGP